MKNIFKILFSIVVIGVAVNLCNMDSYASNIPGRIESMIKSVNVLELKDKKTNDTIIVDSADLRYMATQLDEMNAIFGR